MDLQRLQGFINVHCGQLIPQILLSFNECSRGGISSGIDDDVRPKSVLVVGAFRLSCSLDDESGMST